MSNLNEKEVKTFTKEEVETALQLAHSEYFMQVVALMSHLPEVKELNYVKVPVTTPDGGTYLVSILHVEGPKVDLKALGTAAEALEKKS